MEIENIGQIEVETSQDPSQNIPVETEKVGPAGLSAYEIALKNGFVGTEQEWLDSLVGEKGATGEAGPTGATGEPGRDGAIQYTAGDNITIENNVISATVPSIDLSNYYTKTEINKNMPILDFVSEITYISPFGTLLTENDKTKISNFLNIVYANGQHSFGINFSYNENYGQSILFTNVGGDTLIQRKPTAINLYALVVKSTIGEQYKPIYSYRLQMNMTWSGDTVTLGTTRIIETTANFLPTNNESSYTPTGNYNPATKKYVDDSIASAITTTLGGSY